jgi:hypothetical protein
MIKIYATLLSIILLSCTPVGNFSVEGWETFKKEGYSIQYPSDWDLDESGVYNTDFIFYLPLEEGDVFQENINCLKEDISGNPLSIDEYVELSTQQIYNYIESADILSSEEFDNNGLTFYEIEYTGKQSSFDLKWRQWITIHKNIVYIFNL